MGYMKHNAIVVTSLDVKALKEAHGKAVEIFELAFRNDPMVKNGASLVSPIIDGIINSQQSFFIAPDGSKEGWSTSRIGEEARKEFQDWFLKNDNYCDYVEIRFGGDDEHESIMRSKHMDLDKSETS